MSGICLQRWGGECDVYRPFFWPPIGDEARHGKNWSTYQERCYGHKMRLEIESFSYPKNRIVCYPKSQRLGGEWHWNKSFGSSGNSTTSSWVEYGLRSRFLRCGDAGVWTAMSAPWRWEATDKVGEARHQNLDHDGPWVKHLSKCGCSFHFGFWGRFRCWNMRTRTQYSSFRRNRLLLHRGCLLVQGVCCFWIFAREDLQDGICGIWRIPNSKVANKII